eukprot:NODE_20304_length_804_cov_2.793205.p2 GENE.NODE_20304_length_804_cov_2.793205~~NODE_20304_length_804_cov_2.793205.p2  ORF type:complete len:76 (-),score=1.18 NODE_20304_length_804_cov_2.793205:458-685(-)
MRACVLATLDLGFPVTIGVSCSQLKTCIHVDQPLMFRPSSRAVPLACVSMYSNGKACQTVSVPTALRRRTQQTEY